MTNPSIPPCPVCGDQPCETILHLTGINPVTCYDCCGTQATLQDWEAHCISVIGIACAAHGVTTIAQLTERLELLEQYRANNDAQIRRIAELESVAPDPRVALYEELIFAVGRKYAAETRHETALRYIHQAESNTSETNDAAQRGEG